MGVKKAQKPAISLKHRKRGDGLSSTKDKDSNSVLKKQSKLHVKSVKSKKVSSAQTRPSTKSRTQHTPNKVALRIQSSDCEVPVLIRDNTQTQKVQNSLDIVENNEKAHEMPEAIKKGHTEIAATVRVPYRLPSLSEQNIARISQVVGAIFIIVGGLFSATTMNGSYGDVLSLVGRDAATVITSTDTTQTNTGSPAIDPEPESRVIVDAQEDVLKGTVPITVTVPYAAEVRLSVERKADGRVLFLGTMNRVDTTTWRFLWQTTEMLNGEYRFRVIIKNEFGIYEQAHSDTYRVENILSNTQSQVSADNATQSDFSLTATSTANADASLSDVSETVSAPTSTENVRPYIATSEDLPLSGGALFRIYAPTTNEAKVYARSAETKILHYVGLAIKKGDGLWEIEWKTRTVPNGTYTVFAKINNSTFDQTAPLTVEVRNDLGTSFATSSASIVTQTKVPNTVVKLQEEGDLSKSAVVQITVDSPVQWVELYALLKNSLTPYFLGLAKQVSETEWKYIWETTQTPNGEYLAYARVRSVHGFSESARVQVIIKNQIYTAYSKEEEVKIDAIKDVEKNLINEASDVETVLENATATTKKVTYIEPVAAFIETIHEEDEIKDLVRSVLDDYRTKVDQKIIELSKAIREGDVYAEEQIKADIEALKQQLVAELVGDIDDEELLNAVNSYASKISFELQELTVNNEKIIKDRVGDAITSDADQDGISDYDEIQLYGTNPFVADTDGDSYIDSTEVTLGFNALDSTNKNLVIYESPKETGSVRDDLLVVESVTTLSKDNNSVEVSSSVPQQPRAIISGRALPNSFVTLYIFSSPVIVTVRTDTNGNWSYIFDKEIEDGSHEVYIGITDNNGRIIAKSSAFPFVKTAEAFSDGSIVNDQEIIQESVPALVGNRLVLILASCIVLLFGGVLLYLGFHASRQNIGTDTNQLALSSLMPGHHD